MPDHNATHTPTSDALKVVTLLGILAVPVAVAWAFRPRRDGDLSAGKRAAGDGNQVVFLDDGATGAVVYTLACALMPDGGQGRTIRVRLDGGGERWAYPGEVTKRAAGVPAGGWDCDHPTYPNGRPYPGPPGSIVGTAPPSMVRPGGVCDPDVEVWKQRFQDALGRHAWLTGGVGLGADDQGSAVVVVGVREASTEVHEAIAAAELAAGTPRVPIEVAIVGDVYALGAERHAAGRPTASYHTSGKVGL